MDTREQIKNKVIETLNEITSINGKVYLDNLYALNESKLPAIIVTTGQEEYENMSLGKPFVIQKTLGLTINILSVVKGSYQTTLADYKNLIEKKINETNTLNNFVQSIYITSVVQEIDDEREVALAYLTLVLECVYRVVSNDIDTIL